MSVGQNIGNLIGKARIAPSAAASFPSCNETESREHPGSRKDAENAPSGFLWSCRACRRPQTPENRSPFQSSRSSWLLSEPSWRWAARSKSVGSSRCPCRKSTQIYKLTYEEPASIQSSSTCSAFARALTATTAEAIKSIFQIRMLILLSGLFEEFGNGSAHSRTRREWWRQSDFTGSTCSGTCPCNYPTNCNSACR